MSGADPFGALDALPRWVAWRTETRAGRATKAPYDPRTDRRAASDEPTTWADRAAATRCAARIVNGAGGGVGIMLGDHHGLALGDIDLDTCRAAAGRIRVAVATLDRGCRRRRCVPA